ncbi:TPA: conjugal transfer protein TraT [Escherichia coli]|nr:conjugal transfer protein TraT [Escherichia coli]
MQHSIKDLWLYPFPEIDVVHTQEPLLPEPELTTPGRCICCRQNVRHRFRLDDSWPLRQLTDTISDTRVRLNKATEHLDKLKKRGEPVATGEKEKYNTAVKAAERALEQARLSARRLSLRHVQKAEITSTESLSEKEQELFHEDGPPYSLCAFCHAWHSLNGYAAAQGVMVWLWALNSSPKDSALRKTLTNKLGSVRARKILAENFPRGSATSLIEHRAGQHNSDNVIEELASELIRKQGYNL